MSKKKNASKGAMPPFPGMMPPLPLPLPLPIDAKAHKKAKKKAEKKLKKKLKKLKKSPVAQGAEKVKKDSEAKAKKLGKGAKQFWGKSIDRRKAALEDSKGQYNKFFAYMMDMQDDLASSLPDELPSIPGVPTIPLSPKDFMAALKEFEEMANEHFLEQADSTMDFFIVVEQKTYDMIPEGSAEAEEGATEAAEEEAEEEVAEAAEEAADDNAEEAEEETSESAETEEEVAE